MIISYLYKILPDSRAVVIYAPRILQAIVSAIGDFYTVKLSSKLHGSSASKWTLFSICTSWFIFYCSTRTLTNMAEASFTAIGLYYYPWKTTLVRKGNRISWFYLIPACLSFMMRPTAAVTWSALYVWHLCRMGENFLFLCIRTFCAGIVFLSVFLWVDYSCYQKLAFTPLNFFHFNWSHDIGSFYGQHPCYWYFAVGFPAVLATHFVFFIIGATVRKTRHFFYVVIYFLLVMSQIPHKEMRFLLPVLPLCFCIIGVVLSELSNDKLVICKMRISSFLVYVASAVMLIANIGVSVYLSRFHQRGVLDAVHFLSNDVTDESSVLFLMPCHSTPYYSHIHKNITMRFLTCEPNFDLYEDYKDEAEVFFNDPKSWLQAYFSELDVQKSPPTHILMFDNLYHSINELLTAESYKLCHEFKHADYVQGRVGHFVYIMCKAKLRTL